MTPLLRLARAYLKFCVELTFRCILMTYYLFVYVFVEMPMRRLEVGYRVHSGTSQPTGRWCIFAIAQKSAVSTNLSAFLSCLRDVGYNVILVNNGNLSDNLTSRYLPYCHTIIERSYGGRDFGSYQWGTRTLRSMHSDQSQISQVVYCNDSIFVRPSTFRLLLDRIIQMDADYICMMEVFFLHYHVQSWFFAVSGRVFESAAFGQFWETYIPYSYRRHTINKGEVGISKHLMRNGIYPQPLYSQNMIINLMFSGNATDILNRMIKLLSPGDYERASKQIRDTNLGGSIEDNISMTLLKRNFMENLAKSNTMHSVNLLLLKGGEFPFLKKDLIYRAQYFFAQIEDSVEDWSGEDAEHLPEILAYFRSRDSLRWARSPAGMLARMGLI
jgi:Rhamnan synthesis protein F